MLPHSLLPSLRREGAAETATLRKRSDALVKYYGLAREVFIFYIILLEQMQYFIVLLYPHYYSYEVFHSLRYVSGSVSSLCQTSYLDTPKCFRLV